MFRPPCVVFYERPMFIMFNIGRYINVKNIFLIFFAGVVLSWDLPEDKSSYAEIDKYEIFAYQETPAPPSCSLWKRVSLCTAFSLVFTMHS